MKRLLIFLIILIANNSYCQNPYTSTGNIRGFIYEKESGEPIIFCNVFLKGTNIGSATDINGMYNIAKVQAGNYTIVATYIGYDTTEIATDHGSASWAAVSDERYKKDITSSTAGLAFINDLRPVTFKFKQKNELDTDIYGYDAVSTDTDGYTDKVAHGFIAQEIKTVIDNHSEIKEGQEIWKVAADAKSNRQSVSYIGMIPMLVKALQEADDKIDALTARVTTLEG